MKRFALAASVALGMSAMVAPAAVADPWYDCFEQVQEDCALFFPQGTAQWAGCVENITPIQCDPPPGAAITVLGEDLWGKLS